MNNIKPTEVHAQSEISTVSGLFVRKLNDYGTDDITHINQVIARMGEKLERLKRLSGQARFAGKVEDETGIDTLRDLAGYAVIGSLILQAKWGNTNVGVDTITPTHTDNHLLIQRTSGAKQYPLPTPSRAGDVGFDLYTVQDTIIPSHEEKPTDVPTGVRVKLPTGYWALVINRSSTPRKMGIEVVPGIIDNGYTGELYACCFNRTGRGINISAGTRLAQFILLPAFIPQILEVDKLPETERSEQGFGSTGQ